MSSSTLAGVSQACFEGMLRGGGEGGNYLLSPTSLFAVLCQLIAGTNDMVQMLNILHVVGSKSRDALYGELHTMYGELGAVVGGGQLVLTNVDVDGKFLNVLKKYHPRLDVVVGANVGRLNAWVAEKTGGLITAVDVRLPLPEDAVVLTSVMVFDWEWKKHFTALSREMPFVSASGVAKNMPFMVLGGVRLPIVSTATSDTVAVPFANGCYAYLTLPTGAHGVFEAVRDLHAVIGKRGDSVRHASVELVEVKLPVFSVDYAIGDVLQETSTELKALAGMGLEKVAANGSVQRLQQVSQTLRVEFGVSGVRAAAVTVAVTGRGVDLNVERKRALVFNRPFAYALMTRGDLPVVVGVFGGGL